MEVWRFILTFKTTKTRQSSIVNLQPSLWLTWNKTKIKLNKTKTHGKTRWTKIFWPTVKNTGGGSMRVPKRPFVFLQRNAKLELHPKSHSFFDYKIFYFVRKPGWPFGCNCKISYFAFKKRMAVWVRAFDSYSRIKKEWMI